MGVTKGGGTSSKQKQKANMRRKYTADLIISISVCDEAAAAAVAGLEKDGGV